MADNDALEGQSPEAEVRQPGLRFLETAVYIMGGLLVLMLIALIVGIAWKIKARGSEPPLATHQIDLGLPADAAISHMVLDGDRLAITTGSEIIVVDIRKGHVLSRLKLR